VTSQPFGSSDIYKEEQALGREKLNQSGQNLRKQLELDRALTPTEKGLMPNVDITAESRAGRPVFPQATLDSAKARAANELFGFGNSGQVSQGPAPSMVQPVSVGSMPVASSVPGMDSERKRQAEILIGLRNPDTTPEVVKLQGQISNLNQRLQTMAPNDPDRAGTLMQVQQLTDVVNKSGNFQDKYGGNTDDRVSNRETSVLTNYQNAKGQGDTIARLRQLNANNQVPEGPLANAALFGKQLAASFGVDVSGAAPGEELRSLAQQLALGKAGEIKPVSNSDITMLLSAVPSLANTKEGRDALINWMDAMRQRQIQMGDLARQHVAELRAAGKPARLDDDFVYKWGDYIDKNPIAGLLGAMPAATGGNPPPGQPAPAAPPSGTTGSGIQWKLEP
jgi:hypothetical protein